MWHAGKIFSFAWKYLRPYSGRLLTGILCGLLFAACNGSFIWLTRAFSARFQGADDSPNRPAITNISATASADVNAPASDLIATNRPAAGHAPAVQDPGESGARKSGNRFSAWLKSQGAVLNERLDPWFPRTGVEVTWRHVVALVLLLPLLAVIRGGLDYLSNYCMGWASERAIRDMRMDVMEKLAFLSLDYFTRANTGDLITRITNDTHTLLRSARNGAPDLLKESFSLVIVFGGLCLIDWKLTVVAMIILPACIVPVLLLGLRARKAARSARKISVVQTSQLVELISSIRIIKAFNLERQEIERFRKKSTEMVRAGMKGVQAKESMGPMIEVAAAFALGLVLLFIFSTQRSLTDLPAFVLGFLLFFQSLRKLATVHFLFEQAHVSVQHLVEIMAEQPKVSDPASPKPSVGFNTGLRLERVQFDYGQEQILRDVQLDIPRGFHLGIAGTSGSGKTTLVNLLFRFYDPTGGAIKIDGVDLRDISLHHLRQQMALVSQDVTLFDMTVAENIALGKPGATRAEVEEAARAAFAHDFIMQLPEGYDTRPGERGATLSGGQKQRICIARAFVRDAPILVLDEATASLDTKAEVEVQAAIDRLAQHRTVVCIAHRLSTLSSMDQIIVLSEGRIVEQGGFQELLQRGGIFAGMAAGQGILPAPAVAIPH